ncbi:guanosine-5'-triphosphate, 3'-diphosphatepyrophosphatase [Leptospira ryugenii]|uniref:Guanosine-5'-triphosphate, 3'-diphosphatepyrophosphatase n=1 Tax=Leptospira ryugenii TaxID=1917863 RepID=A0A2P2E280_9LEPT|nr:Ppx/GppA phosphatase family protein [Leptospira ryugenii]GBF50959.1 guanosine-5'-triphosphate, 3'-diphosphatepyrophosphatase [Leptospira ryugenii]
MIPLGQRFKSRLQAESKERILAAIDLGTNSFHIVIVKVRLDGTLESLTKEKETVRLGSGSADYAVIQEDAFDRGIACLKRFKTLADSYKADIRAVATSALREAENRDVFLRRAEIEVGLKIDVISGNEEARLIYLGILQGLPLYEKRILMIDIGGGSTELLVGEKGEILFSSSLKLGAIRLTEKFLKKDPITALDLQKCKIHIESVLSAFIPQIEPWKPFTVVGSSGTVTSLASMILEKAGEKRERLNGYEFRYDQFKEVKKHLLEADTVKKRLKLPGLESKRADIIVGGLLVLDEVLHRLKAQSVTVSDFALRDGIVYDTIESYFRLESSPVPELGNIREKAIKTIANLYPNGKAHAKQVTLLTLQLFDDLKDVHKLGGVEREYLEAACHLHQVGLCISHHSYHKHSYYIIRHSDAMVGFSNAEIEIIALIARYHRKGGPKQKHEEFKVLRPEDQLLVKKLAALLRIGDGLDRSETSILNSVSAKVIGNRVICELFHDKNKDPHLELWSVEEKKDLFENTFPFQIEFVSVMK